MTHLIWTPQAPIPLLALFVVGAASLFGRLVFARRRLVFGTMAHIAGLTVLAGLLAGPMTASTRESPARPTLVLLIDDSQSMGHINPETRQSRLESLRSRWLNPGFLAELNNRANSQAILVRESPAPVPTSRIAHLAASADETALVASLKAAIAAAGEKGRVLALTDGIETIEDETKLSELGNLAAARGVRIDAVVPGSGTAAPDVRLTARAEPPVVYAGQTSQLKITVVSHDVRGEAELVVRRRGEEVARRAMTLRESQAIDIPVQPVADEHGSDAFTVEIVTRVDEANTANNQRSVIIDVIDDAVRVALLEARPYWETSFLIKALQDDSQIDLTTVTALTDTREMVRRYAPRAMANADASFDPAVIAEFDVIVLGRGVERWFGGERAELLRNFVVEQGGALVLLRGDPVEGEDDEAQSLRDVIRDVAPVQFGVGAMVGGVLGLTEEGREVETIVSDDDSLQSALVDLPNVLATQRVVGEKALSMIWMRQAPRSTFGRVEVEPDDPPALALMQVGQGRVLAVLADGLWRWALAPEGTRDSRELYGQLWRRLTRWLALGGEFDPGELLSLRAAQSEHAPNQPITINIRSRRSFDGARPIVTLAHPDGDVSYLPVQDFESDQAAWSVTFTPEQEGVYIVRAAAPGGDESASMRLSIFENRREWLDTTPRRELMREIAQNSGGSLWELDDAEAYLKQLEERHSEVSSELAPAWSRPWVFAIAAALYITGWILERRERAR